MELTLDLTPQAIGVALAIFGLRVANNALFTVRMILVNRGKRWIAASFAFIESLIFAYTIASVVTDLNNALNLLAYCGGFALGGYAGMWVESKFVAHYMTVNVISPTGHDIAESLRDNGFGVTETVGMGREGQVMMLRSVVQDKELNDLMKTVHEMDANAFVAVEETRTIQHGWMRTARGTFRKK